MPDPDPFEPIESVTDYNPYDPYRFDDDDENDDDNEAGETEANYDSTVNRNTTAPSSVAEGIVDYSLSTVPDIADLVVEQEATLEDTVPDQGPELPEYEDPFAP